MVLSGAITTTSDFQAVSDMLVITVRVQDSGEDPFSDIAYLNLVFGEPHGNTNADINQDIVIAIAVIASIIVTVLILTIIGLLCRRYRLIQQHKTLMAIKGKLEPSLGHTDPIPDVVIDRYGIPLNMDVSLQSSIAGVGEKPSMLISSGPMANGLVYDSERDSIIVQPWGNNTQVCYHIHFKCMIIRHKEYNLPLFVNLSNFIQILCHKKYTSFMENKHNQNHNCSSILMVKKFHLRKYTYDNNFDASLNIF